MRKRPITITLPENMIKDLHSYIPRRKMSSFIFNSIYPQLEAEKEKWAADFRDAAADEELQKEMEIWDVCLGDGLDETNEYKA